MLSAFLSTGVIDAWRAEAIGGSLNIAKRRAKTEGSKEPGPDEEKPQSPAGFLLELLLIGGSTAAVMFFMEAVVSRLVSFTLIEKLTKQT